MRRPLDIIQCLLARGELHWQLELITQILSLHFHHQIVLL